MNIGKRIFIFDTSVINGEKNTNSFFGGRDELNKFSVLGEIVFPDMVIDEIRNHKKQYLISEKSKFLANPFRHLLKIDQEKLDAVNPDDLVDSLLASETIDHTVIKLTKEGSLERIKKMCHANKAPFGEREDKGFKDAYILLTVEEFLESVEEDAEIFVVVKDGKLNEALCSLQRVTVIEDFKEFEAYNKSQFTQEYFLERLSETLGTEMKADDILRVDLNINDNWVLEIDTDEMPTYIEIDFRSKEPINHKKLDIKKSINGLINSGNFDTTDEFVEKLSDYVQFLNKNQMIELIKAAISNNQIFWIAGKETLKQFFFPIFEKLEQVLDDEIRQGFIEKFEYERK